MIGVKEVVGFFYSVLFGVVKFVIGVVFIDGFFD